MKLLIQLYSYIIFQSDSTLPQRSFDIPFGILGSVTAWVQVFLYLYPLFFQNFSLIMILLIFMNIRKFNDFNISYED